jgi:hypothetical protein
MIMDVDLRRLRKLLGIQGDEIEKSVVGTGYLARTVIGVGTFLLDNEGDLELLSAKQRVTYEKFLQPLLDLPQSGPADKKCHAADSRECYTVATVYCGRGGSTKPGDKETDMSKGVDSKKETKKAPAKTPKEKKAEKKIKKAEKSS